MRRASAPFILVIATGCASAADESPPAQPPAACTPLPDSASLPASFISDIAPLWDRKCTGFLCHLAPSDANSDEDFLSDWVDQPSAAAASALLIVAGDPAASFLMHKLDATHDCGAFTCPTEACGNSMPIGEPLTEDERAQFRGWIAAGARAD
jgi:hypothetical protein